MSSSSSSSEDESSSNNDSRDAWQPSHPDVLCILDGPSLARPPRAYLLPSLHFQTFLGRISLLLVVHCAVLAIVGQRLLDDALQGTLLIIIIGVGIFNWSGPLTPPLLGSLCGSINIFHWWKATPC